MDLPDAQALLARIAAVSRPAGSAAEADARAACAAWLLNLGLVVNDRPFSYSALPGAWGTPIAGLALLLTATGTAAAVRSGASPTHTLGRVAIALVTIAGAGWWVGRYGTRLIPVMRRQSVNMEASRGVPRVWLVAHLDSKSQPCSLLVRAWSAVTVGVTWVCLLLALAASLRFAVPTVLLSGLAWLAAAASVPLAASWVGTEGAGALDNASGVVSVLAAVSLLDLAVPVGVVLTSAEEFGLAGARAWVDGRKAGIVINCDGVDDFGAVTVTAGRTGRRMWRALVNGSGAGTNVRVRRSLPGVLLDSVAFSDQGWTACTVSRGTRQSLARVHTSRDRLAKLKGEGIAEVSNVIAFVAGAIIAGKKQPSI